MTSLHAIRTGALVALTVLWLSAPAWAGDRIDDRLFDLQLVPLDGQTPPPFRIETLDGRRGSLSDFKGQVVLLYFWASW